MKCRDTSNNVKTRCFTLINTRRETSFVVYVLTMYAFLSVMYVVRTFLNYVNHEDTAVTTLSPKDVDLTFTTKEFSMLI